MSMQDTRQNLVKISTASHLSGIRIETLRAWDKRGQLQPTQRVGNTRYYTTAQVERMKALNALIQSGIGYTIGELCDRSDTEIQRLYAQMNEDPSLLATPTSPARNKAVVAGWRLEQLRDTQLEDDDIMIVTPNLDDVETFFQYLRRLDHADLDIVVIELPSTWDLNYINSLREQSTGTTIRTVTLSPFHS